MMYVAEIIECPFDGGRWQVLRRSRVGTRVSVMSCATREIAERERKKLQREFDEAHDPTPHGLGQLSFRFFEPDNVL